MQLLTFLLVLRVLKVVCQQFSAGMKTVAVIPVLPHGVVQLGSHLRITENMGFINDVTTLILQLGEVPGILLSDTYASKESASTIGVPACIGNSTSVDLSLESNMINSSSLVTDSSYHSRSSVHASVLDNQTSYSLAREIQNGFQSTNASFQASNSNPSHFKSHNYNQEAKIDLAVNFNSSVNQLINGVVKAEVIPANSVKWSSLDLHSHSSSSLNLGSERCMQQSCSVSQGPLRSTTVSGSIPRSAVSKNSSLISGTNEGSVTLAPVEVSELCKGVSQNMKTVSGISSVSNAKSAADKNITSECWAISGLKNVALPKLEASFAESVGHPTTNSSHACSSGSQYQHMDKKFEQSELYGCSEEIEYYIAQAHDIPLFQHDDTFVEDDEKNKFGIQNHSLNSTKFDVPYVQPQSGDDLFDILGADFKNKLFNSCWNSGLNNKSSPYMQNSDTNSFPSKKNLESSEILATRQGSSASGIFSTRTDHLLDAIVSNVQTPIIHSMDDTVSCRTTLTNTSSSSVPNVSLPYSRFGISDPMKGELFGVPKYLAKPGATSSCSLKTVFSRDSRTYSQSSSIHGSQISSWIEKGHNAKLNNSVSTGCSKKPDEMNKSNRKRLKSGENPRPRPKDRQMIQDRVKELREIVPNGAKCSIDSLLERTIKHMLFLQSVTKHADKLKQTGQSKIISNDGSLLLKDNFEGGATWAYEVGSHSMVCPIIVEDLNQPRQMLVEMLCEERGLFLEIADIIRGLGLSILKGVMETRKDKIWVQFAVEANRDVTRMEIFISLVRLLEQSSKSWVPQANHISNDKTIVQQFHQVVSPPSLPVTGVSHNFP